MKQLQELHQKLIETNARWTAGVTSLSHLTTEEFSKMLGAQPSEDSPEADPLPPVQLPTNYFLINVNGVNYVDPVQNQGTCKSCAAFATAATIEITAKFQTQTPVAEPPYQKLPLLSEGQLFYCGGSDGCEHGWNITSALNYCQSTGITPLVYYPYESGANACHLQTGSKQVMTRIAAYSSMSKTEEMKIWLFTKGALAARMETYEDFKHYSGGVYRHTWGENLGGHAISVIGYSDELGAWLCKNSWGTGWGNNGFFFIEYGQCEIDKTMYGVTLNNSQLFKMPTYQTRLFGDWLSAASVAMVSFKNKLYATFVGSGGGMYIISSNDAQAWSTPQKILSNWTSKLRVPLNLTVATINGVETMFMAIVGYRGDMWVASTTDGQVWTPYPVMEKWAGLNPIGIASFNNEIYVTITGLDGKCYLVKSSDGKNYSSPIHLFGNWTTLYAITIKAFKDQLYIGFIGSDLCTYVATTNDGNNWPAAPSKLFDTQNTNTGLEMGSLHHTFYFGTLDFSNGLYFAPHQPGDAYMVKPVFLKGMASSHPMKMAEFNGALYFTYIGWFGEVYLAKLEQ